MGLWRGSEKLTVTTLPEAEIALAARLDCRRAFLNIAEDVQKPVDGLLRECGVQSDCVVEELGGGC